MSESPRYLSSNRIAELALLVGTVFWGCSFTWAKDGADAMNASIGASAGSALGPILLLGIRFLLGGMIWLAIFAPARRGWSLVSVLRCIFLGMLLFMAMTFQVVGLLTTTEAVSAFLTSLTVLFVPLLMTIALRRPPGLAAWVGVILATAGIWLMTSAAPAGIGAGELLGICASMSFAIYILAVNSIVPKDHPSRITAGQFVVCGIISLVTVAVAAQVRHAQVDFSTARFFVSDVLRPLVLLVLLPTLCAYGLLMRYQPLVDPTRAAILYLAEPIFAGGYAWIVAGRKMGPREIAGALLILIANLVVEFLSRANGDKME
jgi:drug/metabolite transporter (DMT)-like permease